MSASIITQGRLGNDPETKAIGDSTVTDFRMAVNTWHKGANHTDWFSVSMWGKRGEWIAQHFKKGDAIFVVGQFRQDEVVDDVGNTQTWLNIQATDAQFVLGSKNSEASAQKSTPVKEDEIPF